LHPVIPLRLAKLRLQGPVARRVCLVVSVCGCNAILGLDARTLEDSVDLASACRGFFEIEYSVCNPSVPPTERSRILPRIEQACKNELSLPGIGLTSDWLNACGAAIQQSGCASNATSACNIPPGLEPGGAACNVNEQCHSGYCTIQALTDGGWPSCGTCTSTIAIGQPCGIGQDTCDRSAQCIGSPATCQPLGDVGASCEPLPCKTVTGCRTCKDGLHCDSQTHQCSRPEGIGAACSLNGDCAEPLVCGPTPNRTCQSPGGLGASCASASCAAGLTCDTLKNTCVAIVLAGPGQACDQATQCLVGRCKGIAVFAVPDAAPATLSCPSVLHDGDRCDQNDPSTTCDTAAECQGGVCAPVFSVQCK
jgi:hypothetical protein